MRRPGWPTVFFNPGWIGLSHPYVPYKVVGHHLHCQSQAPLAAKRPEGRWLSPTLYLKSRIAFSISAWRRWSASSSRVSQSRSVMQP